MSNIVIKAEDLSKQYRLGEVGTGTIQHDLKRWWYKVRGKEDPFLKIGETNDRTKKGESEFVWALKDINFEIGQGDVVGIIGRNGAGKSTLLKILSKTTLPTTGSIKVKGRIASLLEVGTGFHPELTGRDNIFLNGAILGMTKKEIKRKFDEIVDFAGVERYIDTPVKRYSSGMYVRLAFGVAAHLESEILIVDEVLAVGDAEFQKKAIGKMQDVSTGEGRTVLFVSHNMASIQKLCKSAILLKQGKIYETGIPDVIIQQYLREEQVAIYSKNSIGGINVKGVALINSRGEKVDSVNSLEELFIEMDVTASRNFEDVSFAIGINDIKSVRVITLWSRFLTDKINIEAGLYKIVFKIESLRLIPGEYSLTTYIDAKGIEIERIDNFMQTVISLRKKDEYKFEPRASQGMYMEKFDFNLLRV